MKKFRTLCWRILIILFAVLFCVQLYFFVQIGLWRFYNPSSTSFMRTQLALLQQKNPKAKLQFKWVNYNRISNNLKRAIIAAEDSRFSEHEGVDWDALQKAFEKNQRKGKIAAGGSTITQQLAKNLFLSGERSYLRKVQEFIITYMLEFWMGKERILEIYLNVIELGKGVFGAEAGARHYFGISAAQLNNEQSAKLAAMLPSPRFYDKNRDTLYLEKRTSLILYRMNSAELP